jgi:aminoglycoside phosphotransferase (APT) family kinase protein
MPGQVLKVYEDWCSPELVDAEVQATKIAHAAGLSVPEVGEELEFEGRRAFVLERIDGISMLAAIKSRPWTVASLSFTLGRLHAQMHKVQAEGLPRLAQILPERVRQAAKAGLLPSERLEPLLEQAASLPDGDVLCHMDFHPDNVQLSSRGPVILDWMTGAAGHPMADVARTVLLLTGGGDPPGQTLPVWLRFARWVAYFQYLRGYGIRRQAYLPWMPVVAAGRLNERVPGEREGLLRLIGR